MKIAGMEVRITETPMTENQYKKFVESMAEFAIEKLKEQRKE